MNYIKREKEEFFKLLFLKKYLIGTNGIIAGGCFKNIFNGEQIKDIDMFFRNKNDFNEANNKYSKNKEFKFYYENKNAVAYEEVKTGIVVELIKKTFGEPNEILDQFDFSITKFCYYYEVDCDDEGLCLFDYYILHHPKFFEHLHERKLVLDNDKLLYPFSVLERSYRYCKYGYSLCRDSKINLINAIRNTNEFNDRDDLSQSFYDGID